MSLAAAASVALFLPVAAESSSSNISAHLTFEDAVRIARDRSPDLAIADADVLASRAQLRAAGAIPNPAASFADRERDRGRARSGPELRPLTPKGAAGHSFGLG